MVDQVVQGVAWAKDVSLILIAPLASASADSARRLLCIVRMARPVRARPGLIAEVARLAKTVRCVLEQDCLSQVCQLDTCIGAIDQCRLDAPFEYTHVQGEPVTVAGIIYELGTTDRSMQVDLAAHIDVEVGFGPDGTNPTGNNAELGAGPRRQRLERG